MYCTRCGLRVEEGIRYCPACGQEVGVSVALPPTSVALPPSTVGVPVSAPQPYAGFWVRFVAYLIDGVILGIPFFLAVVVLVFLFGGLRLLARRGPVGPPDPTFAGPLFIVVSVASLFFVGAQWLYFSGMESSERQATFGKAAMSLRVTDLEGRRLTFGHATGRFFAKIVSGVVPLAIGYIMAGFTEKKQALHDMIASTVVLRNF
jgi:uncharacterized RDD family membrane protein YckC